MDLVDPQFVHLRIHTEYSLVDGIVCVKPLVEMAAQDRMPALAITDHSNLFAAVKFYSAAEAAGIKPILGADLYLLPDQNDAPPFLITFLCQNQIGYRALTRLVSRAYVEGQQQGKPYIQRDWITPEAVEGLIALSGASKGDIGHALLQNKTALAEELLDFWHRVLPQRFYLEIQRIGHESEKTYDQAVLQLAARHQMPIVATNDVCFLEADDFEAHEARVAIHNGYTLADPKRPQHYTAQQFFRTQQEMQVLFSDLPEALINSVEIAKRCNLEMELGKIFLPAYPVPPGLSISEYLTTLAQTRLEQILEEQTDLPCDKSIYKTRLETELRVISDMGYAGYFLIVADFIGWAKEHNIPVGPGRGSGAGSLVAYVLGITGLDPLQYDLLFERFLNPERVSMPDFDIDFCMDQRDNVIGYVSEKYGRDSVSQIITFGTMAARAVVRDVGRVLDHPYGFVDKIAKLIPFELGITLEKALNDSEELKQRYDQEDEVKILIDLAKKLEGIARNAGKHAGGVVIAPSALTDFVPLYCEPDGESLVTQYDKDDVESVGLVKFDFLGLRTLTMIAEAVQTVNQQHPHELPLNITKIPLNDPKTFALLKNCITTAVFQLESRGMKDLIKRLQPDCFEDIIALVALFRPGPLQSGMVDDFINRKHGRAAAEYFHPALKPILTPTYGVILYQEQVMQIAQVLAGYSLGSADLLRRAMGKKKPEEMAQQRNIFVTGAQKNNVSEKLATHIFDLMEKFAGYGFNKSHSAAYALVAYQTAWLKAHYPEAFMAAVLSSDMDHTDKVVNFIDECRQLNIEVLPPDINQGRFKFTVNEKKQIFYGLGAVKGVGEAAIEMIIATRTEDGFITDLFDFCRRVNARKVNRRAIEALIRAGAFDQLNSHRASLFQSLDKAIKAAEQQVRDEDCGQADLFGMTHAIAEPAQQLVACAPWTEQERLEGEKETLGLYLTGHPMNRYRNELKHIVKTPLGQLYHHSEHNVVIAGMITAVRIMLTKRGDKMAFITLEDQTGKADITIFSELYETNKALLIKDALLIVEGEVTADQYTNGYRLLCKNVCDLTKARNLYAKYLKISITEKMMTAQMDAKLKETLLRFTGGDFPVKLHYTSDSAQTLLNLDASWQIHPSESLLQQLRDLLGESAIECVYDV